MVIGALSFRFFSHFGWKGAIQRDSEVAPTGVCRESEFPPTIAVSRQQESGIGVPSYNSRQPSAVSKSRESEFPPTEELNSPKRRTKPLSFRFFSHFGWKCAIQRSLLLGSVGNRSSLLQKN